MTTIYVVVLNISAPWKKQTRNCPHMVPGCDDGVFLASGRRVPRTGGIILARSESLIILERRMEQDPLHQAGLTRMQIFPFQPSMNVEAFNPLLA
jgi:uncharacterized protein YciI